MEEERVYTQYELDQVLEDLRELEIQEQYIDTDIVKIKNSNTIQQEQIYLLKDKIQQLKNIMSEKTNIIQELKIKNPGNNFELSDNESEEEDIEFLKKKKSPAQEIQENEQEQARVQQRKQEIMQLYNQYLKSEISKMSEYDLENRDNQEDQNLEEDEEDLELKKQQAQKINNKHYITVRLKLPEVDFNNIKDTYNLTVNFRFSKKTTIKDLKEYACKYWQINLLLKKHQEGQNNNQDQVLDQNDIILSVQQQQEQNYQSEQHKFNYAEENDEFYFMELCDENFAHISNNEILEDFLLLKGFKDFSNANLILKQKQSNTQTIEGRSLQSAQIQGGAPTKQKVSLQFSQPKHLNVDPYEEFFNLYPNLKIFINSNTKQLKEKIESTNHKQIKDFKVLSDTNCCVILFLFLQFIFNFIFWTSAIDTFDEYYIIQAIKSKLELQNDQYFQSIVYPQSLEIDENIQEQYNSLPDLQTYLQKYIAEGLFDSEYSTGSNISQNYQLVGPVRLRQIRLPFIECQKYVLESQINSCRDKEKLIYVKDPFGEQEMDWMNYKTPQEANSTNTFTSQITGFNYNGGGYLIDFPKTMKREKFVKEIEQVFDYNFINNETQIIFITINVHSFTTDQWIYINLALEKTVFNTLHIAQPEIIIYKPNIYHGENGTYLQQLDYTRLVFTLFLTLFVIKQLKIFQGKINIKYLMSSYGCLNVLIITFSLLSISQSFYHYYENKDNDPEELLNTEIFLDMHDPAYDYVQIFFYQTLTLFFLVLRSVSMLRISNHLKLLVDTLEYASAQIIAYLLIFLPLMIGFTFIFKLLWGPYIQQFFTFTDAFNQIIQMSLGNIMVIEIFKTKSSLSLIYIIVYYFVVVFLLYAFFVGQLIESYREIVMKIGYPTQQPSQFTLSQGIQWFFSWMPESLFIKLRKLRNYLFQQENQENTEQLIGNEDQEEQQKLNQ